MFLLVIQKFVLNSVFEPNGQDFAIVNYNFFDDRNQETLDDLSIGFFEGGLEVYETLVLQIVGHNEPRCLLDKLRVGHRE